MISADNIFPKSNNLFALAYTICRNKSRVIRSIFGDPTGILRFHADVKAPDNHFWDYMNTEVLPQVRSCIEGKEWNEIRLKDILPKNFARPELDKRRLGDVVDLFTNVQMIEHGDEKDILGRTYEYCLSMFAEQEGKRGGEFFTPSCVVRTLVEVLQPFKGRVYENCTTSLIRVAAA